MANFQCKPDVTEWQEAERLNLPFQRFAVSTAYCPALSRCCPALVPLTAFQAKLLWILELRRLCQHSPANFEKKVFRAVRRCPTGCHPYAFTYYGRRQRILCKLGSPRARSFWRRPMRWSCFQRSKSPQYYFTLKVHSWGKFLCVIQQ